MPTQVMPKKSRRQQVIERWGALDHERQSWMPHWQELTKYLLPRSGRYFVEERNRGERRHNAIYDSTGTDAVQTMASGMMAGANSPARPWFRLTIDDPELADFEPVQLWLEEVQQLMLRVFEESNTYNTLHQMYEELGVFGTAVSVVLEDFDTVIHHYPVTVGEFCLAQDDRGKVNCLARKYGMTVAQVVGKFGLESCSQSVKDRWNNGNLESPVTVLHLIEPREDRDASMADNRNMPFSSRYLEFGSNTDSKNNTSQFLSESGFERFPVLAPRWSVAGGDIYGNSPGMKALGDVKGLQVMTHRLGVGIDRMTDPPTQAPSILKQKGVNRLPGGVTYFDATGPHNSIRSLYDVKIDLNHLQLHMDRKAMQIQRAFYADLFLMIANAVDHRKTATEVAQLYEEKLIILGPVLTRLHGEMHKPLIEMTFHRMRQAGMLPPAPLELVRSGRSVRVKFVSMLAQAQEMVGLHASDRFVFSLGAIGEWAPEVRDRFDADGWVDDYAQRSGVSRKMIKPKKVADGLREQRAAALKAKDQAEMLMAASRATRDFASSPTGGEPNALTDAVSQVSGYQTAPPPVAMAG